MNTSQDNSLDALPAHALSYLQSPPFIIKAVRAFTFPLVVLTRKQIGERYYRVAPFGRLVFIICALPGSAVAMSLAQSFGILGTIWGAISVLVGIAAVILFFVRDREIRREIDGRRESGEVVHSYSIGVNRFGLPDDDYTNRVLIPLGTVVVGLVLALFAPALGAYVGGSGLYVYAEYTWRAHSMREAYLDAADRSIGFDQLPKAQATAMCSPAEAKKMANRVPTANPLAGFEEMLTKKS